MFQTLMLKVLRQVKVSRVKDFFTEKRICNFLTLLKFLFVSYVVCARVWLVDGSEFWFKHINVVM